MQAFAALVWAPLPSSRAGGAGVAIHAIAVRAEAPHGSPRRCAPRNDGAGYEPATSARMIFAPSTIACILPKATSRGRYFRPQSGATMMSSAAT
jgi:hypothetical protein